MKQSDKITDQRLFNLYVEEIKSLRKALQIDFKSFDDLTSTQKLKLNQMTALLEQLDISAAKLKKSLGSAINSHLMDTGQIAYNELFYEFESGNGGVNFALLRDDELRTLIETPVANFKLSERINDGIVPDLQKNIKNELTRLFLNGESMGKVSSRLAEVGYSSYRRAMMITRTEAGRVQAITRQKAQLEAERLDIQFEKQWVATLDKRTRHNHALLDGVRVNPDGYFEINGHKTKQPHMFGLASEDINCRCRTISVLIDDTEPMLRRDNETGEVVEYKNYRDWLNSTMERRLASNARNSINKRLYRKYNIDSKTTTDLSIDTLKSVNETLDNLLRKHKGIKPYLKKVNFVDNLGETTASAGMRFNHGNLELSLKLNKSHFKDIKFTENLIDSRVKDGIWSPKNGIDGLLEHEIIHLLEFKAITKRYGNLYGINNDIQKRKIRNAFSSCELAKEIKKTALNNLNIDNNNAIIKSMIGEYATENPSEFLAEAYSDNSNSKIAIEVRRIINKKWR